MQREADVVKVAALCVMSPDQHSCHKTPSRGSGERKKNNRMKVSPFLFSVCDEHAAGVCASELRVDGTGASPFQASCESTPGSVSMPARAPVSHILQLGRCHHWAPGPSHKPHETEYIYIYM